MSFNISFPADDEGRLQKPFGLWLKKRRWFILTVLLPTFLAGLYYGLIASDIYISESRFVIKSPDQRRSQISTLANLVQSTGLSAGHEQANEVLTYARSRGALAELQKNIDIQSKFSTGRADYLSRFPSPFRDKSFEELFKYYGKRVDARVDAELGIAIIRVEAFTPQDAFAINQNLLNLSEALVNKLNDRAKSQGILESEKQVALATKRVKNARMELAQFRNSAALIDPARQAGGVLDIANDLIAQRAIVNAQLEMMQRLTPRNPSIPALRSRVSALSSQIASQESRVVGTSGGIASKMGGFENLLVEQEFSTQSLTAANAALLQARADAQRQQFYLQRIVDPNVPDTPLLPNRFLNILVVFAASMCIYFIAWMFIIGVLEHAPED